MKAHALSLISKPIVRTLVPAIAGFLAYGGWGYFCNMAYGWQIGLRSGIVQGSYSFAITLAYTGLMEWMYQRTQSRLISIPLCTGLLVFTSYAINAVIGTPEILATIAPGAVIGSFYVYGYISGLAALTNKQAG